MRRAIVTGLSSVLLVVACRDFSLPQGPYDGGSGGHASGASAGGSGGAADAGGNALTDAGDADVSVAPVDARTDGADARADRPDGAGGQHAIPDASIDGDAGDPGPVDFQYSDPTGRMTINVRTCAPSEPGDAPQATCDTPPGFVLIGGGAEILGNSDDPAKGAVLSRSSPTSGCFEWGAGSFDREPGSFVHQIRVYSIGLRLQSRSRPGTYITAVALRAVSSCYTTTMPADGGQYVYTPAPGRVLVGGGFSQADGKLPDGGPAPDPHIALIESYPTGYGWVGRSALLDPVVQGATNRITGITFPESIDDFGKIEALFFRQTANCQLGHTCASDYPLSSAAGVVTSIGGVAQFSGSGRYLSALRPLVEANGQTVAGASVVTRDFLGSDERGSDVAVANQNVILVLRALP